MVITIGGRYGSGGKVVAARAAELLGYRLCTDDVITEAVKNSEFDMAEETFRYFDESQGQAALSELARLSAAQRSSFIQTLKDSSVDIVPLGQAMTEIQDTVLNRLADEGSCILLGRCANHFLAGRRDVLSVFVLDDDEHCRARIMERFPELTAKEAEKLIKKTNKRRQDYYSFFAGKDWGDAANYAMVLNCALLGGAESAAEYLAGAVRAGE